MRTRTGALNRFLGDFSGRNSPTAPIPSMYKAEALPLFGEPLFADKVLTSWGGLSVVLQESRIFIGSATGN